MEISEIIENRQLSTPLQELILDSYNRVRDLKESEKEYTLPQLIQQVDSQLYDRYSFLIDEVILSCVKKNTTSIEIDTYSMEFEQDLEEASKYAKTLFNIVLISKILDREIFLRETITPALLKNNFEGGYTADLIYILLSAQKTSLSRHNILFF
jgi:hypothetical protein